MIALLLRIAPLAGCSAPKAVPLPSVDGIDYDDPSAYLALPPSLGTRGRIEEVASGIHGDTFEAKLDGISVWIRTHLEDDPEAAYAWRDFDQLVSDGRYGGCAAHSVVYGALARALGIPTVWVKTMDVDWIRAFRSGPEPTTWRGHVFLEVHDGERWRLLDAQGQRLSDDYAPGARLLPGGRYAYDKGGDPFALVLSTRWELWLEQTRRYFADFDLARLPVPEGRPVAPDRRVFVAASNPAWDLVTERFRALGRDIGPSGNTGFDQWMPEVPGATLVVVSVGDAEPLPEPWRSRYRPSDLAAFAEARRDEPGWAYRWTADDETRVILLHARDEETLGTIVPILDPED